MKLSNLRFAELDAGVKFTTSAMDGVFEKICGNAAVRPNKQGGFSTFTFEPDEVVRAYSGTCFIQAI